MLPILLTGNNSIAGYNYPHYSRYNLTHYSLSEKNDPKDIFSVWQPEWLQYRLIHTFGTVTYTDQPWIYTFEARQSQISVLQKDPKLLAKTRQWLDQDSCKKIICTSHYSQQQFIHLHQDWTGLDQLKSKLEVVYPSFSEFNFPAKSDLNADQHLHLVLAENSFNARAGMGEYLKKSFSVSPYSPSETIYRCVAQFDFLNRKYTNTEINPFELTHLSEWQQAVQLLGPESETYSLWEFL